MAKTSCFRICPFMYRDLSSSVRGMRCFFPTAKNFSIHGHGMTFVMYSAKIKNGFRQVPRLGSEEPKYHKTPPHDGTAFLFYAYELWKRFRRVKLTPRRSRKQIFQHAPASRSTYANDGGSVRALHISPLAIARRFSSRACARPCPGNASAR